MNPKTMLNAMFNGDIPTCIDPDGKDNALISGVDFLSLQALTAAMLATEIAPDNLIVQSPIPVLFRTNCVQTGEMVTLLCISLPDDNAPGKRKTIPVAQMLGAPNEATPKFRGPGVGDRLVGTRGEVNCKDANEPVQAEELGNIFAGLSNTSKYRH